MTIGPLEYGVLWPLAYASLFDAPIRRDRLASHIVGRLANEDEIAGALASEPLRSLVVDEGGLLWLRASRTDEKEAAFARRVAETRALLARSAEAVATMCSLPGVRLAALSGGCAHDAATDQDVDLFLVTRTGALWRTLLRATLVSKARGWRRVLCVNYLVDETALSLDRRDFYAGYELMSLRPLSGRDRYARLIAANPWLAEIFPNFFRSTVDVQNRGNDLEGVARANALESTARMILRPYLRYRLPNSSGVELGDHVVRLHAQDHRERLRGQYKEVLQGMGLEAPPWI